MSTENKDALMVSVGSGANSIDEQGINPDYIGFNSPKASLKNNERFRHETEEEKLSPTDRKQGDYPEDMDTIYYSRKGSKRILFFEMKIKRIAEINTSKETFRCRFHIYLTWLADKSECQEYDRLLSERKQKEYIPLWKPTFSWQNAIAVHQTDYSTNNEVIYKIKNGWIPNTSLSKGAWSEDIVKEFGFTPHHARWIRVKYEYDVEFAEELELPAFPFDCQDLTMYLKADTNKVELFDIVPFPRPNEFCILDPEFSVLSEWDFESMVVEFYKTDSVKSKSSKEYALVGIHVKASRRWEAHIGHMIVIFCMFTLGLAAFAQDLKGEELGNRLSYCVTLLLADVATLQLLFDNLPNIPYWTIFDYYIYVCFAWLFGVTGWTGLAGRFGRLRKYDLELSILGVIFYFVSHIIFLLWALYDRQKERQKLTMTSIQLQRYFNTTKLARDRSAISVKWNKTKCIDNVSEIDESGYGIYAKGEKKVKDENNRNIFNSFLGR